ncbi:MAG: cupin domain-containing protein, partial [Betaproteobacteria bacterium]
SALRHWHTLDDEFVYVLSGEVTLVTDSGEQKLGAGMRVGYPANSGDAHHLVNRSAATATYLEVGGRVDDDECFYPDDDLLLVDNNARYAHKNGSLYP